MSARRRVRVLIGPRGADWGSNSSVHQALSRHWDVSGVDLAYQFSRSVEDGKRKARFAIEEGVDTILVVGGDGIVNSIGAELLNSGVALGVIPAGSGNGFARHFNIPLNPESAIRVLFGADRRAIDVGTANGRPFFVTCSMAWDAAIVRSFEKSPVRGMLPYVLAAATEFMTYAPQPFEVKLDGGDVRRYTDPLVFTVANLTQYGGGAQVAPHACPDDGQLELVVVLRQDAPKLLANLNKLFDGTFNHLPDVMHARFRALHVHRREAAPIQVDGELVDAPADVDVQVLPRALTVLVPSGAQ